MWHESLATAAAKRRPTAARICPVCAAECTSGIPSIRGRKIGGRPQCPNPKCGPYVSSARARRQLHVRAPPPAPHPPHVCECVHNLSGTLSRSGIRESPCHPGVAALSRCTLHALMFYSSSPPPLLSSSISSYNMETVYEYYVLYTSTARQGAGAEVG